MLDINNDNKKLSTKIFQKFQENALEHLEIRGLIYVPKKIVIGLCSTNFDIEDDYPNLPLLFSSDWK